MSDKLDNKQEIQEEQYKFPYHYIPKLTDSEFLQTRHWSWGFRYLGGIQVVLKQLEKISFDSIVDIGCGDGRFLSELKKKYPDVRMTGIDYSNKAIQMAKAMNHEINYRKLNVIEEPTGSNFDVATLIEVLEHIPPPKINSFLKGVTEELNSGGVMIITVPHSNNPVSDKHYQHFNMTKLKKLLKPFFEDFNFYFLDKNSLVMGVLLRLLGGKGENFIITNSKLNLWFFKIYCEYYLYADEEENCVRIAVVCKKK